MSDGQYRTDRSSTQHDGLMRPELVMRADRELARDDRAADEMNTSLLSQRLRRLDPKHAPRRKIAGDQRDHAQTERDGDERRRIERRDADQQAADDVTAENTIVKNRGPRATASGLRTAASMDGRSAPF
jgi:hypothetical protein